MTALPTLVRFPLGFWSHILVEFSHGPLISLPICRAEQYLATQGLSFDGETPGFFSNLPTRYFGLVSCNLILPRCVFLGSWALLWPERQVRILPTLPLLWGLARLFRCMARLVPRTCTMRPPRSVAVHCFLVLAPLWAHADFRKRGKLRGREVPDAFQDGALIEDAVERRVAFRF